MRKVPIINYAFGIDNALTFKDAFIQHHATCPMCKGNSEPNGKFYQGRTQRTCLGCQYPFTPPEPTEEAVKDFISFLYPAIEDLVKITK